MTDNPPELPEPVLEGVDYELWGQNAKLDCCSKKQMHSYALSAIASERARADALQVERDKLIRLLNKTIAESCEVDKRADALEAALSRLVLAIDAVGADDTGSEETLGEWHEARESARSLLEKTNGQDERAREICKGNAQTSGDDAEGTCRPSWP